MNRRNFLHSCLQAGLGAGAGRFGDSGRFPKPISHLGNVRF